MSFILKQNWYSMLQYNFSARVEELYSDVDENFLWKAFAGAHFLGKEYLGGFKSYNLIPMHAVNYDTHQFKALTHYVNKRIILIIVFIEINYIVL